MAELQVSYDTLDGLCTVLTMASRSFEVERDLRRSGAFGADEVDDAFSVFWTSQEHAAGWLADTSRTLARYTDDTRSLFEHADDDLAGRAGATGTAGSAGAAGFAGSGRATG